MKTVSLNLEFIDMSYKSMKQLEELTGMELLTLESKDIFLKWCSQIKVAKRIDHYCSLIIEHQNELAYRKKRDEEYKFSDIFEHFSYRKSRLENRRNKAVLPIHVSEKQINRAYRIANTLINSLNDLGGTITVESGEKDNAKIILFEQAFSFQLIEVMVKRRSLLTGKQLENKPVEFRPMYEKIHSGILEIKFTEVSDYWRKDDATTINFVDSNEKPIEKQLGEAFKSLLKVANESKIAYFIVELERELKEQEQRCLNEKAEQRRKKLQKIEEQQYRKQRLIQNIDLHMENWYLSKKFRNYADDLEIFSSNVADQTTKELLEMYIHLVRQKAESCDPVTNIIQEIKMLVEDGQDDYNPEDT